MALVSLSCRQEQVNRCVHEGEITGYDYSRCMCCGGYLLDIPQGVFRLDGAPEAFMAELDQLEERDFPVAVRVNFDSTAISCIDMRIDLVCADFIDN
ncbi:MAG: hypothetical protein AAFY71_20660 [Bacteroidota bacterium]